MIVTDVNLDGIRDVVTSDRAQGVSILISNGDGTFAPLQHFMASGGALLAADVNLDGTPDLVIIDTTADAGIVAVLLHR